MQRIDFIYTANKPAYILLCLILACVVWPGCGMRQDAPTVPPALPNPAATAPGGFNLPAPQELLALSPRSASATPVLEQYGADFDPLLPHNLLSAVDSDGEFAPAWDRGGTPQFSDLAYGVYGFNVPDAPQPARIRVQWSTLPPYMFHGVAGPADCWIGVANFTRGRWDWFPAPVLGAADVQLPAWDDYRVSGGADDGRVLLALALLGQAPASLYMVALTAYDELEPNENLDLGEYNNLPDLSFSGFRGNVGSGGIYDGDNLDLFWLDTYQGLAPNDWFYLEVRFDAGEGRVLASLEDSNGVVTALEEYEPGWLVFMPERNFKAQPRYVLRVSAEAGWLDYTIRATRGLPPYARLSLDPAEGAAPLAVTCDASTSVFLDNPLACYVWHFGDGSPALVTTDAVVPHNYTADGVYTVWVQAFDTDGMWGEATQPLLVGEIPYDERENNDTRTQANALGALPVQGFRGSYGHVLPGYPGYDGDMDDYFSYSAAEGDQLILQLRYTPVPGAFLSLDLLDESGSKVADSVDPQYWYEPFFTPSVVYYTVPPGAGGTYYTRINWLASGDSDTPQNDYELDVLLGEPPVAGFSATPDNGALPLSVQFDANASSDPDAGGGIALYQWDWECDGVYDESTVAPVTVHEFSTAGVYVCRLLVTDVSGAQAAAMHSILAGVPYDEVEDNDTQDTPNVLPALPVLGYRGHLNFPGYDGDANDWFQFTTPVVTGKEVLVKLDFTPDDPSQWGPTPYVIDAGNVTLAEAMDDAHPRLQFSMDQFSQPPYRIRVSANTLLAMDYTMDVRIGQAPGATLFATPESGAMPLTVYFTSAGSFDQDGTLEHFEWDWEGDGVWDYDSGTIATASHEYNGNWIFNPRVRVLDNEGFYGVASVYVWSNNFLYDEREPNDQRFQGNPLALVPGGGFSAFNGSLRTGAGYHDYDDGDDYLDLVAVAGKTVTFTLTFVETQGKFGLRLYSKHDAIVAQSDWGGGHSPQTLSYTFAVGEDGPASLWVCSPLGYGCGDYSLDGAMTP